MTIKTNAFIKDNFLGLLILLGIIVGVVLFMRSGCGTPANPAAPVLVKTDTKSTSDTNTSKISLQFPEQHPTPSTTVVPIYAPSQVQPVQPATDVSGLTAQVVGLNNTVRELADQVFKQNQKLQTENWYNDTTKLIDSSGFVAGEFTLKELVKNNELASRSKAYTLRSRLITNTSTTTNSFVQPQAPKSHLMLGGSVFGNQSSIVDGAGAGFIIVNKKGNALLIEGTVNKNVSVGGRVGFYKGVF